MLHIAICDDEQIIMEQLKKLLEAHRPDCIVTMYLRGEGLLDTFNQYDLVFLDIEMPPASGMELAAKLKELQYDGEVIFLTSYTDYMQDAFKVRAFRYLQKPVREDQLEEALCAAEEELQQQYLVLTGEKVFRIKIQDILYLEAVHNETYIVTKNGELVVRSSMREIYEMLDPAEFIQTHKSYVVALRAIRYVGNQEVVLQELQPRIPLSRRRQQEVRKAYMEYIKKHAIYL